MHSYIFIAVASLGAAMLTLFSGFGLGTLLLPAFALFFPVPVAVAATAIVHLFNNIFKLALLGRKAHAPTVVRFGVPAAAASLAGASLLTRLGQSAPLLVYEIGGRSHAVTPITLTIGLLMIVFALFELVPRLSALSFDRKYLIAGGLASGFAGGLSGHQGALRAAFLIRSGLDKEAYIATSVVVAVIVDICRLSVYGAAFMSTGLAAAGGAVTVAVVAAFVGSFLGARLIGKTTFRGVQLTVGVLLLVVGALLAGGLI